MSIEVDGNTIATTESGFLENPDDWDIIRYLRDEYFSNNGNQPNNRALLKEMSSRWGHKVSNKKLFELFPGNPSKQAGRLSGLPESMRKGGY